MTWKHVAQSLSDAWPSILAPKWHGAMVEEPEVLLCPITHGMYRDPVFIPESGNSYEREAIETWLKSHQRDPLSNVALSGLWYTNWGIRRGVQSFLEANPDYTPQGWEATHTKRDGVVMLVL